NTSAGSVPLALDEAVAEGRVKAGDRIVLSGFGAGLAWGTAGVRWGTSPLPPRRCHRRPPPRGSTRALHAFFEHTADLGLRVRAADLDALFAEAAQALFEAIVEDPSSVRPLQAVEMKLVGDDREYLLFDWLKDLLYRFDAEHLLFGKFEAHV